MPHGRPTGLLRTAASGGGSRWSDRRRLETAEIEASDEAKRGVLKRTLQRRPRRQRRDRSFPAADCPTIPSGGGGGQQYPEHSGPPPPPPGTPPADRPGRRPAGPAPPPG